MATPEWNASANGADSFGPKGRPVTPAGTDLDPSAKAIVMLATGDITVVPDGNANATPLAFIGLPAGYIIPYRVRRVTACSSSCATID
jgi:hypothetical protein